MTIRNTDNAAEADIVSQSKYARKKAKGVRPDTLAKIKAAGVKISETPAVITPSAQAVRDAKEWVATILIVTFFQVSKVFGKKEFVETFMEHTIGDNDGLAVRASFGSDEAVKAFINRTIDIMEKMVYMANPDKDVNDLINQFLEIVRHEPDALNREEILAFFDDYDGDSMQAPIEITNATMLAITYFLQFAEKIFFAAKVSEHITEEGYVSAQNLLVKTAAEYSLNFQPQKQEESKMPEAINTVKPEAMQAAATVQADAANGVNDGTAVWPAEQVQAGPENMSTESQAGLTPESQSDAKSSTADAGGLGSAAQEAARTAEAVSAAKSHDKKKEDKPSAAMEAVKSAGSTMALGFFVGAGTYFGVRAAEWVTRKVVSLVVSGGESTAS